MVDPATSTDELDHAMLARAGINLNQPGVVRAATPAPACHPRRHQPRDGGAFHRRAVTAW
jgi:hypothetical protein